ncbi:MAG: DNA mismatch repair protein MutS [Thermodesulfobacteriota bacterium]
MKNPTPAMRQYLEIKAQNPDAILFFRMGDFYEMFFEDAAVASRALGIALTSRDREKKVPMCGVPYHAAGSYIARLVKEGHKVAVCEQTTPPGNGIVERAVTRVITPGVAFDPELLDPRANNFIAAACLDHRSRCGFAYMDATTGEFRLTEFSGPEAVHDEIRRVRPLELVVQEESAAEFSPHEHSVKKITPLGKYDYDLKVASARLNEHFSTVSLDGFGCSGLTHALRAAGALLHYIKQTQRSPLVHVRRCTPYDTGDYLVMDASTRRNLEITGNIRSGGPEGTLLALLDRTRTAMGGRRIRNWLLHPLKDVALIEDRLDAVEELVEARAERGEMVKLLDGVYDIERLIVRVTLGVAGPRDLISLKESLKKIPRLKEFVDVFSSTLLARAAASLDPVSEAVHAIEEAIVDEPPLTVRDGGVIKEGYSPTLEELRETGAGGKDRIAALEAGERARTGINTLKIGYNRVFGYYIEITRSNLSGVPEDYIRKQTLVNAERFITPALKEWEEKILTAEEKARELEASLFSDIVKEITGFAARVHSTAEALATLDALCSLAVIAQERDYTRPSVDSGPGIEIEGGRHPVIEASSGADGFVANDLSLHNDTCSLVILTGPNMAGKSTYLRQNALIVLMAQIGSFVPAARARIGVVDRIFTRVGASDDLARGQSTFMVEMNETANILNNATPASLVILDEIGRGTSTFDGLSIAWAVVEYLHDNPGLGAKTLFATHYHELTELSLTKERVKNYNMAVKEWDDKIIFLRKVVPGGSSRSYGIQVARLAGLPGEVIERATGILRNLETGELNDSGMPRIAIKEGSGGPGEGQMSLLGERDPLREELRGLDLPNTTPIEALNFLNRIKERLDN